MTKTKIAETINTILWLYPAIQYPQDAMHKALADRVITPDELADIIDNWDEYWLKKA